MLEPELPGRIVGGQPTSAVLDLSGLGQRFEAFLRDIYHPRRHGGTNEAPLARWQARAFLPNMPESLDALDMLLLRVAKPRKVLRDGIRLLLVVKSSASSLPLVRYLAASLGAQSLAQ